MEFVEEGRIMMPELRKKGENVLLYGVEVWKGAHLGQDVQGML